MQATIWPGRCWRNDLGTPRTRNQHLALGCFRKIRGVREIRGSSNCSSWLDAPAALAELQSSGEQR